MNDEDRYITEIIGKNTFNLRVVSDECFIIAMIQVVGEVKYFYKKFTDGVIDTVKHRKEIIHDPNHHEEVISKFYAALDEIFNKNEWR